MKLTKEMLVKMINESVEMDMNEMSKRPTAKQRPVIQVPKTIADLKVIKRETVDKVKQENNGGFGEETQLIYKDVGKQLKALDVPHQVVAWSINDTEYITFRCDQPLLEWVQNNQTFLEKLREVLPPGVDISSSSAPKGCPARRINRGSEILDPVPGFSSKTDVSSTPQDLRWVSALKGGKRPKYKEDDPNVDVGTYDTQNWILRGPGRNPGINPLIEEFFDNDEMANHLSRISVPRIILERENSNVKPFNDYKLSNESVDYTLINFNSYKSSEDFFNQARAKLTNSDAENIALEYSLARQHNQIYSNWLETKKNDVKFQGETEKYKLKRFGLEEGNYDITIKSILNIKGTMNRNEEGGTFTWTVTFTTKMGKKLSNEYTITGGLEKDLDLTSTKTANLTFPDGDYSYGTKTLQNVEGKDVVQHYTIMRDESVVNALKEAMQDIANQLKQIKPINVLRKASSVGVKVSSQPSQPQSQGGQQLAEGLVDDIIKKLLYKK